MLSAYDITEIVSFYDYIVALFLSLPTSLPTLQIDFLLIFDFKIMSSDLSVSS